MKMIIRHRINKLVYAKLSTTSNSDKLRYSNTVLLPKTKLPLRLEGKKLTDRDTLLNTNIQSSELYEWQRKNLKGNEFILHDGPPYANGEPHMGHAINKILKDVILRQNILQGNKVHYIPGWDCHGLPIELKAIADSNESNSLLIRKKGRAFATDALKKQRDAFMSWGILGEWDKPYATYNPNYIKNQIKQFYQLYQNNLVYRDIKPVYWSPSSRTALAEAELEYNPSHKSTSLTFKVKLQSVPSTLSSDKPIYGLIWTTTPWTLPSNQAVCYNPKLSYAIIENLANGDYYIAATNLVSDISNKLKSELKIIESFEGHVLKNCTYIHPIYKSEILRFLPAYHALETKGTGLVHTAPAHGPEDYLVALENHINVICMVDEHGKFTSEAGTDLAGLFVLTNGNKAILNMLDQDAVHIEDYHHSYPYDWRTKEPVILRASKQWFIDTNSIKEKALNFLENIKIIPEIHTEVYRNYFKTQLEKRPYWCISRQRAWGVPIPAFYFKDTDDIIINEDTIESICSFIDKNSCDFWWYLETKDILQESLREKHNIDLTNVKKGEDILDIWFDSGISWSSVLPDEQVADLYLEGVDQFTGWFQSSLLTSVALRNKAPFKTIYVHGFAVDQHGKKMSKSLGNVINPTDIIKGTKVRTAFGIDCLRWWVACHASQDAKTEVSNTVMQASKDEVQKIRSVLRFAVAALHDYENTIVNYNDLKLMDKYMLHLLSCYQKETEDYLNNYQFHKVKTSVIQFLTNYVSALYYYSIKDRLYCDSQDSLNRKSAQYVLRIIQQIVTRSIAPIVPHLAEEMHAHLTFMEVDSIFKTSKFNVCDEWYSAELLEVMDYILKLRKDLNRQIVSNTLNKCVSIYINNEKYNKLKQHINDDSLTMELCDIFQVADVELIKDDTLHKDVHKLKIVNSNKHNCPRCRKFLSNNDEELCYRCNTIVSDLKIKVVN